MVVKNHSSKFSGFFKKNEPLVVGIFELIIGLIALYVGVLPFWVHEAIIFQCIAIVAATLCIIFGLWDILYNGEKDAAIVFWIVSGFWLALAGFCLGICAALLIRSLPGEMGMTKSDIMRSVGAMGAISALFLIVIGIWKMGLHCRGDSLKGDGLTAENQEQHKSKSRAKNANHSSGGKRGFIMEDEEDL